MAATQLQKSSTASEPMEDTNEIQSRILPTSISFTNLASDDDFSAPSVIPGGVVGLALLGLGSTALVGSELIETLNQYPMVV